jgi:membrane protein required for colicin V production
MEPHSGFNTLDYIVIGIVLLSGLLALMRGLVREIFSLIAWVGAYLAAVKFYPYALPTAHHYLKTDKAAEWGAMAAVFLITLIVLMIIGALVCSLIKGRALTSIDRSLGFIYGLARGALVVSLVYMGVTTILWPDIDTYQLPKIGEEQTPQAKDHNEPPDLLIQAKTRPALHNGAELLKNFIPRGILDDKLKDIDSVSKNAAAAAKQQMLDTLSTPAPPGESMVRVIDTSKPPSPESKP